VNTEQRLWQEWKMSVTLHTNHGDVKLEIFCDSVPRTAFNFLALAASGYYDGTLLHRNVRSFMVQGGDPTGTGKGGESIWGGKFPDEIRAELTHSARGTLSMANSGPGTNASQFFITYAKHPHLDNSQCPSCAAQCPMPAAAAPHCCFSKAARTLTDECAALRRLHCLWEGDRRMGGAIFHRTDTVQ
jgi:peptidyl-prolyl cis-trans isomerase-like 3